MKFLNSLLKVEGENRTVVQIIGRWEIRRFLYNAIVMVCGLISLLIVHLIVKLKPGEDLIEPIAILGFVFICNITYTFGWLIEIIGIKSKKYGSKMFKIGLYLTVFLVVIPAIVPIVNFLTH